MEGRMAKESLVVNGYKVPSGYSGASVRRACELVIAEPGIKQRDLLERSVMYSGINLSTAGWITSPGPKSPATLLWDRHKEGIFRCYPNAFTEIATGAQDALFDAIMNDVRLSLRGVKYRPAVGDLVGADDTVGKRWTEGIFIGYSFNRGIPSPTLYNTIEDIIAARPPCKIGDQVFMDIIENGTGRRVFEWRFGKIHPL
jgi:hypothetical protein